MVLRSRVDAADPFATAPAPSPGLPAGYLDDLIARAELGAATGWDRADQTGRVNRLAAERGSHLVEAVSSAMRATDPFAAGFSLHYQPVMQVPNGRLVGAEALIRFTHPDAGLLLPDLFMAVVQESGLMEQLTLAVVAAASAQHLAWRHQGIVVPIGVNVASSALLSEGFALHLTNRLRDTAAGPDAIALEVPEIALTRSREACRDVFGHLRALGIRIAIDNFGTGLSTDEALRNVPADLLKIDRNYVRSLLRVPRIATKVGATIRLAHDLGLQVVAQGVENDDQLERLGAMGIDAVQGFLLSAPLAADELPGWVRSTFPEGL